jgi:hypothetical protein
MISTPLHSIFGFLHVFKALFQWGKEEGRGFKPSGLQNYTYKPEFKQKPKKIQRFLGPWRLGHSAQEGFESPPSYFFARRINTQGKNTHGHQNLN